MNKKIKKNKKEYNKQLMGGWTNMSYEQWCWFNNRCLYDFTELNKLLEEEGKNDGLQQI